MLGVGEFSDLQCRITRDPVFSGISMVFYTKNSNGRIYVMKPMVLEMIPHEESSRVEPTIQISGSAAESFLRSLAQALDNQGIKTDSDHKIQGTLEATKTHLDDMRNLVYMLMGTSSGGEDHEHRNND